MSLYIHTHTHYIYKRFRLALNNQPQVASCLTIPRTLHTTHNKIFTWNAATQSFPGIVVYLAAYSIINVKILMFTQSAQGKNEALHFHRIHFKLGFFFLFGGGGFTFGELASESALFSVRAFAQSLPEMIYYKVLQCMKIVYCIAGVFLKICSFKKYLLLKF